jgi:hypothetical protein
MSLLHAGAVAVLLASGAISPALATCVSKKCSDAALVERARVSIQQTCGCMRAGQPHRAYMTCVKKALKAAELPELTLQRPCRNAVKRCESKSICGQPDAVVCCRTKKSGKVAASMRKSAANCKNGTACGASLGLYSTFDACDPTGACAQGATTTTTPTAATTTTLPASSCEAEKAAFEATLPVPTPGPSGYVVQLVNESNVTLLAATNAAHKPGQPPFPVLPRERTWVIEPRGVLTIDIPLEWQGTVGHPRPGGEATGPVFWARTGCRFDIAHDIAQCETGGCGGFYDCSNAILTPPGAKSLAEWTFNDPNNRNWSFPDVSVVDGVNLNMDIQPIGPHTEHMPSEPRWLDHPLVKCGGDQRDVPFWCPDRFALRRRNLASKMFIEGSPGGDDVVACFSNCGLYKYPTEPNENCTPDPATDLRCYYWKTFCVRFPAPGPFPYDISCNSNADCTQHGVCWNPCPGQNCRSCLSGAIRVCSNDASRPCAVDADCPGGTCLPRPPTPGPACCAPSAINKLPDCPPDQCTFPYTPQTPQNQPPFGLCSAVTNATGDPDACIGDDTFHYVMPYGLTWPNDPETFSSDAHAFRIVFAPGGTGAIPVTPAGPIPLCRDLPPNYAYAQAAMTCANDINAGAVFATLQPPPGPPSCKVTNGAIPEGVLCRW